MRSEAATVHSQLPYSVSPSCQVRGGGKRGGERWRLGAKRRIEGNLNRRAEQRRAGDEGWRGREKSRAGGREAKRRGLGVCKGRRAEEERRELEGSEGKKGRRESGKGRDENGREEKEAAARGDGRSGRGERKRGAKEGNGGWGAAGRGEHGRCELVGRTRGKKGREGQ